MTNDYHYIIIDDEPKAIKLLNSIIRRLYKNLHEIGSYTEWTTALAALESNEADLVFIDISMPHRTGINLLEMVIELVPSCSLIINFDILRISLIIFSLLIGSVPKIFQ